MAGMANGRAFAFDPPTISGLYSMAVASPLASAPSHLEGEALTLRLLRLAPFFQFWLASLSCSLLSVCLQLSL